MDFRLIRCTILLQHCSFSISTGDLEIIVNCAFNVMLPSLFRARQHRKTYILQVRFLLQRSKSRRVR
ncbi:unnamed protein product [Haemonchus placei]|uniref:Secreted protein n=1 Tax=Haemonchus placei TaxID=6290 RepID=A0A0N4VXK7_HAEPC|nr:unnamed protein product [Haemonchus placei]